MAQLNIKKNDAANISTPPSGVQALFIGTDGIWYSKSDAGTVSVVANGIVGSSGSSGSSGVNGSVGSSGSSGSSGVNGTSGTSPGGGGSQVLDIINTSTIISLALGATANSAGDQIIIGHNAISNTSNTSAGNIVIGTDAVGNGTDGIYPSRSSVSIGPSSVANWSSVAIGADADANAGGTTAIAIGVEAIASGAGAVAIQRAAAASGDFSHSIGFYSVSSGENSQAIGSYASATHANSVALGAGVASVVSAHTHVKSLHIDTVPVYADNSAATGGGLVAGQVYRTSTGVLMIVY